MKYFLKIAVLGFVCLLGISANADICKRSKWFVEAVEFHLDQPCENITSEDLRLLGSDFNMMNDVWRIWAGKPWPKKVVIKKGDLEGLVVAGISINNWYQTYAHGQPFLGPALVLQPGAFSGVTLLGSDDHGSAISITGWRFEKDEDFSGRAFEGMNATGSVFIYFSQLIGLTRIQNNFMQGMDFKGSKIALRFTGIPDLKKMPASLCKNIPALSDLYLKEIGIETLPEKFLNSCKNLKNVEFDYLLEIKEFPAQPFLGLNLESIKIKTHRLEKLQGDFFQGIVGLKKLFLADGYGLIYNLRHLPENFFEPIKASVEDIELSYVRLENLLPEHFSGAQKLKTLVMTGGGFTKIPAEFCRDCKSLTDLTIKFSKGRLSEIDPLAFKGLGALKKLDLLDNDFSKGIPAETFSDLKSIQDGGISINHPVANEAELRRIYREKIYFR